MRVTSTLYAALLGAMLLPATGQAQSATSDADFIKTAESGAPVTIGSKAAIFRIDPAKKAVTQLRAGSNGFSCSIIPDGTNAPFCADRNAWVWFQSAFTEQPKPTNTEPGISYMAQGGIHFEMPNGDIVMMPGANTKSVSEPPHWMLMWPFDPVASGLPTKPNAGGVYVMFAGTPYAHLMIYQNPNAIR